MMHSYTNVFVQEGKNGFFAKHKMALARVQVEDDPYGSNYVQYSYQKII
jgi:hypothetical protein